MPADEKFGMVMQMRRCAVSIPSNIAEGCGRNSENELRQFLSVALGSSFELETQLQLAFDLNYIDTATLSNLVTALHEIRKMITGLRKSIP